MVKFNVLLSGTTWVVKQAMYAYKSFKTVTLKPFTDSEKEGSKLTSLIFEQRDLQHFNADFFVHVTHFILWHCLVECCIFTCGSSIRMFTSLNTSVFRLFWRHECLWESGYLSAFLLEVCHTAPCGVQKPHMRGCIQTWFSHLSTDTKYICLNWAACVFSLLTWRASNNTVYRMNGFTSR